MKKFNSLLFFFLVVFPTLISAQKFSIGLSAGVSIYQGDLSERFSLAGMAAYKPTIGAFANYQFGDRFSVRASFFKGKISGDERIYTNKLWRKQRGFSFTSPIMETAALAEWAFLKRRIGKHARSTGQSVAIYLVAGLGYTNTQPKVDFNEPNPLFEDVNLDKLAQYSRNHLVVPMGMGIKWQISHHKSLRFEAANRTTFTDYLDGISKTAQPKYRDWYLVPMVLFSQGLTWGNKKGRSHASVSCPKFK
jgi:OmpA-OmpF porin, OOP family